LASRIYVMQQVIEERGAGDIGGLCKIEDEAPDADPTHLRRERTRRGGGIHEERALHADLHGIRHDLVKVGFGGELGGLVFRIEDRSRCACARIPQHEIDLEGERGR
jgi:hypothetical protein